MKLTQKERFNCRVVALSDNPPPHEVVVIPGNSPPDWEECKPYFIDDGFGNMVQTQIRITVGEEYMKTWRKEAVARDKIR